MTRGGRILLVETEGDLRLQIDALLDRAGHEVSAVDSCEGALRLIREGFRPDVVVSGPGPGKAVRLSGVAQKAPLLVADGGLAEGLPTAPDAAVTHCLPDPSVVVASVEELLVSGFAESSGDDTSRCLELGRRLSLSLPRIPDTKGRIDLVSEGLEQFFGLQGSLVLRRAGGDSSWVEARRGLSDDVVSAVSAEIFRRTDGRGLRPFFTEVLADGASHVVAGLGIPFPGGDVDLGFVLERPPGLEARAALAGLLGAAVRAAHSADRLREAEDLLEKRGSSVDRVVAAARSFSRASGMEFLADEVLSVLGHELKVDRSVLFFPDYRGHLTLVSASGFAPKRLDRIGLSINHGVGEQVISASEPVALSSIAPQGAGSREVHLLFEAGLEWGASLPGFADSAAVVFLGGGASVPAAPGAGEGVRDGLLAAAGVAVEYRMRLDRHQRTTSGLASGLVEALENLHPDDRGHSERVAAWAVLLGRALNLSDADLRALSLSARLHDIGKILACGGTGAPPDAGRMKAHAMLGSRLLTHGDLPAGVIEGVEQHHEHFDGTGRPLGLAGESIHLFGRIISVSNALDHRERPSQDDRVPLHDALDRLREGAETLFDPELVPLLAREALRRS
jgi:hypothetical protein